MSVVTVTHPDGTRSTCTSDREYQWAVVREVVDPRAAAIAVRELAEQADTAWRRQGMLDQAAAMLAGLHPRYQVIAWRVSRAAADGTVRAVLSRYDWAGTATSVVPVDPPGRWAGT